MELQAAHALYKDGRLIFTDPHLAPEDGTEVIITYLVMPQDKSPAADPLQALRGRGKGERLVEKLLHSRCEDRDHDAAPR